MLKRHFLVSVAAIAVAVASCTDAPSAPEPDVTPAFAKNSTPSAEVFGTLDAANVALSTNGAPYRIAMAEYITASESGQVGNTILAKNVGNKQLGYDFVPLDPRRGGGREITWLNDALDGATASGLTAVNTLTAITSAMNTWDSQTCSTIPLSAVGSYGFDFGVVQNILGFGGAAGAYADLTHAGWLPAAFFDALTQGGSGFILGVTFTFIFTDGSGGFTDIDGNGRGDTAFREIYYNDAFSWADDGSNNVDVESVALHEAGHGLSQGHFGTVSIKNNGTLNRAPMAVMNAIYSQPLATLQGSDNGGHCSNWGQWPNS